MAKTPAENVNPFDQFDHLRKPEPRGNLRAIADTLLQIGQGGLAVTQGIADAAGANNTASKVIGGINNLVASGLSEQAVFEQAENAARSKVAEGQGAMEEFKAGVQNFTETPGAYIAQGAGSVLPFIAAQRIPGLRTQAAKNTVSAGLGSVAGAGIAKGEIYDAVNRAYLDQGYSPEEADRFATEAQEYTGKNKEQIALAGALGWLTGGTGVESIAARLTAKEIGKESAEGVLKKTLKGGAAEAAPEAVQGGQERYAANTALANEGFDVDPWAGVVDQATIEGLAAAPLGAGAGTIDYMAESRARLAKTLASQGDGAITDAALSAVESGASDQVAARDFMEEPRLTIRQDALSTLARTLGSVNINRAENNLTKEGDQYVGQQDAFADVAAAAGGSLDNQPAGSAATGVLESDAGIGAVAGQPDAGNQQDNAAGISDGQQYSPVTNGMYIEVAGRRYDVDSLEQASAMRFKARKEAEKQGRTGNIDDIPVYSGDGSVLGYVGIGDSVYAEMNNPASRKLYDAPAAAAMAGAEQNQSALRASGNEAITFANAKEGDVVESGGVKFRKVGNGFERVDAIDTSPASVDEAANDRQQTEQQATTNEVATDNKIPQQVTNWDRQNRSSRNEEWQAGAAESNPSFNAVDGANISAHGMAKASTLTEAYKNLVNILANGFDKGRTLYYDSLTSGGRGQGAGTGTAGGHAYRDGPFIITFREGLNGRQPTIDDVTGVLVNPANTDIVPILQQQFPNLVVRDYHNVADVVSASKATNETLAPESLVSTEQGNEYAKPVSQQKTDTTTESNAGAASESNETIRPIVESIAKRRAAAQQMNKEKAFDTALGIAKRMLAGEQVKPGQLQMAARQLKNDAELFDQVSKLVELAKAQAKAARAERAQSAEVYRSRISQAKTEEELQAIAAEIAKDTKLTDTQAADLDDAVMEAMDALDDSGSNDAEEKLAEQIADEVVAEVEADPSALEPKPSDSENAAYLKEQVNERIEQEDGKQAVADAERQAEADIADGSKESGEEVEASEVNVESDLSRVDAGKVLINAKDGYRIQKVGDKYHYSAAGNAEFKTEKLTRDELVEKLAGKKMPTTKAEDQPAIGSSESRDIVLPPHNKYYVSHKEIYGSEQLVSISPLPGRSFSEQEKDSLIEWSRSLGYKFRGFAKSKIKLSINSYSLWQEILSQKDYERIIARKERQINLSEQVKAEEDYLSSAKPTKFVEALFSDSIDHYQTYKMVRFLDGAEDKYNGMPTPKMVSAAKDAGINLDGIQKNSEFGIAVRNLYENLSNQNDDSTKESQAQSADVKTPEQAQSKPLISENANAVWNDAIATRNMATYREYNKQADKDSFERGFKLAIDGMPLPKEAIENRALDEGYSTGARWGDGRKETESVKDEVDKAKEALREAGVKGKDFTDAVKDVRQGNLTADEVAEAHGQKIEDVGEKMAGARKDMEVAARKEWSDEDLATQPLSKIWPAGDIDAIEDTYVAAWAFASRAEIPSKPRKGYRLAAWVAKVKSLRLINAMALDGFLSKDKIQSKLNNFPALKDFDAKVRLLERLPREQWKRIGKVREYPNAYTYDASGVKIGMPQVTVEIDGRSNSYSGGTIDEAIDGIMERVGIAAPEKRMQFEVRGSGGKFHIYKKGDSKYHKLSEPFADPKDAFAFIKESYDELVAAWDGVKDRENIKKTDVRGKGNKARTGENWRNGKNVTPEQFAEQFGFRGVEFGNWVSQGQGNKDRQGLLNQAYDGLMDLASIVGIPPKAISLNGSLGLAFGSRGKGWAAAHFEPGNLVINLTKTKGAGSLAHEWFHALDNYFSRMRGGEIPIERGLNAQEAYRRQNFITYRPEPLYVHKSQPSKGMTAGNLRRYRELSKGSNYYAEENWQKDPKHPNGVRPEVESAFAAVVEALDASPMNARSKGADKGNEGYWSRIIERAARSFENYIIHKMRLNGYDNEYLANVTSPEDFPRNAEIYPYLLETEIQPVADAFDNLFSTIQTKETEKGVAMFNRQFTGSGMAVADVERAVNRIRSGWKNAPEIIVVDNMSDRRIRKAVRDENERQLSQGAEGQPEGFYDARKVYIVASELNSEKDVVRVLFHETLGHAGLRGVYGSELGKILDQVAMMRKKDIAAKAKQYGLDATNPADRRIAAEEVLAEMAQTNPQIGFVKRAIAAIRNFLRKHVPYFKNLELTDADIIQGYLLPARRFVQNGKKANDVRGMVAAFVRNYDDLYAAMLPNWGVKAEYQGETGVYNGARAIKNKFVALVMPEVVDHIHGLQGGGDRIVEFEIRETKHGDRIGSTTIEMRGNKPVALHDIAIDRAYRGNGYAKQVVGALLSAAPGRSMEIIEILDSAEDFWRKSGVHTIGYTDGNATLTWRDFAEANPEARGGKENQHGSFSRSASRGDAEASAYETADAGSEYVRQRPAVDQTQTPQFRNWFGDSVVTDNGKPMSEGGKPLVVYHGTTEDFDSFDIEASTDGVAGWFTTSKEHADVHVRELQTNRQERERGGRYLAGGRILPVFATIKKPLQVDEGELKDRAVSEIVADAKRNGHDGLVIYRKQEGDTVYVAFRPEQIKSVFNRGTFDPANPDIRFSRSAAFDSVSGVFGFNAETAGTRASGDWVSESKIDDLIYTLQDKHVDLKRVQQAIQEESGDIEDGINAYMQEELFHGRSANKTKNFIDDELTPLIDDMRERDVKMADFEEYLWARHAEERNIQIAKVNPDMPDGGSGMTTREARDYLAGLSRLDRANFEALAKHIDKINAKTRQLLVAYGLESQDTIDAWSGAYSNYVPLMREDMDHPSGLGTGQGYSVRGNASKRATGSNRAVVDIVANIAQQRERTIIRGEKNRVALALLGLAKTNPNRNFWKVDEPPTVKTVVNDRVVTMVDPNYKSRDNVVIARYMNDEGKVIERSVVFNEQNPRALRMAQSIKNLDQDQLGEVLGAAAKVTRYFSSINTQYNPVFGVINLLRDTQGAMLNLSSTPIAGKQADVSKKVISALKGIYSDIRRRRKGLEPNSQWSNLWEEFQLEGGQTGYRDLFRNARERAEAIEKSLNPDWWMEGAVGKVLTANGYLAAPERVLADNVVKPVFEWLSDYNESMENAVRLAAYKVALDSGISRQQAASIAKNLTVNFNRRGEAGRQIGALYAFFNASVQGTARIAETLSGRAGRRILQGGLLLGVMQAFMLAGFDDDEPPQWERDRNLIIPTGDGTYIKISMPLGFNALPAFGRIMTEWAMDGFSKPGERMVHIIDMLLDVTNPIGNAGLSLQTIAPTIIDPLAALAENEDWSGRPIAREDFNSLDPTPGFTRAKDSAWAGSMLLAEAINAMTGGTAYKPGAFSPTPDQLDYLIGQLTGGVGRELMKSQQTVTSLVTGDDLPTYKIPLLGRFIGNTEGMAQQGAEFYNNLRELNMHENEIQGRRKAGEDVSEYLQYNPEARLVMLAKHSESLVRKLRKHRRLLKEQGADKEQIVAIDEQITIAMKRFNDAIYRIKNPELG